MGQTQQGMGSSPLAKLQQGQTMPAGWQNAAMTQGPASLGSLGGALGNMAFPRPTSSTGMQTPSGGGALNTLRPPMGAPGQGAGGGKGAGQMGAGLKQQIGRLPGAPPPGAPGQGPGGAKGGNPAQAQAMKQQIAGLQPQRMALAPGVVPR